jgi:hypothetical protein
MFGHGHDDNRAMPNWLLMQPAKVLDRNVQRSLELTGDAMDIAPSPRALCLTRQQH